MNFVEELYFGNINPNEKNIDKESQYAKSLKEFCENEDMLNDMLSGECLRLFNHLVNAHDEMTACIGLENFKLGFILGVRIMTDCFKGDIKTILKDI